MTIEAFIEKFCRGCENYKPDDGDCLVRMPDQRRLGMAMAYESASDKIKDEPVTQSDFCYRRSIAKPEKVLTSGRV